ncbi:MAG TPA: siderophore-interacting protein [Jatrophihabitans sp.]|nr:siderophore-interacting protein [Jatrophihabitans sp.]
MPAASPIARTGQFQARVAAVSQLSPRMRRIELQSPEFATQAWPLGCDVAVVLAAEGREVRRRYTVRSSAGDRLTVDAVLHGHGPGSTWAAGLSAGDPVTFYGPRGELPVPQADWLIALADESGLPAIGALAEAIGPRPLAVYAEIADLGEQYPLPGNVEVRWLARDGVAAGSAELMLAAVAGHAAPAGRGYGYVLGESRAVVSVRDALARLGLDRADVYAKGYWNLQSRPTR